MQEREENSKQRQTLLELILTYGKTIDKDEEQLKGYNSMLQAIIQSVITGTNVTAVKYNGGFCDKNKDKLVAILVESQSDTRKGKELFDAAVSTPLKTILDAMNQPNMGKKKEFDLEYTSFVVGPGNTGKNNGITFGSPGYNFDIEIITKWETKQFL